MFVACDLGCFYLTSAVHTKEGAAKNMIFFLKSGLFNNIIKVRCLAHSRAVSGLNFWNEELSSDVKHKIENFWSKKLTDEKYDEIDRTKQKYYVLSMFPYPSGHLHMGHVRVYTISDTVARFQRMNGKNVIHPIGWDAFGLPAENAAIERNIAPDKWTKINIEYMTKQLKQLGCSFEWDRELTTCDPKYYKWTQELFLKLYDAGLVYQKEAEVNWDPVDETVLADEQVDENGLSWRSGALVERKVLRQWFVKTTKFAKDLLDGLDDPLLQDWRDIIKLQKHWIGECDGICVDFHLTSRDRVQFLTMWSDRPEHMDQTGYIALSRGHLLAKSEGTELDERTKLLKVKATNPITRQEVPIFITDNIEFMHGTDSYLGIPSAKEQDRPFADKYNIPYNPNFTRLLDKEIASKRNYIIKKNGGYYTSAKLKDWLISRQRYWGTPIPMVHCKTCGVQPVSRKELPVLLPESDDVVKGHSALKNNEKWIQTTCKNCGSTAERETDTMDTFVDSSWYFLRYLNPNYEKDMFDVGRAKSMTPVDLYIGGKEHAVLHLYYARFISHFLYSRGLLPEREPFKRLLVQGMVMGRSFRVKGTGKYLPVSAVQIVDTKKNKAVCKETQEPVVIQWEKMSKSKHNGVDPSDMFKEHGIDTTRLLILADVAPTSHRNWNSNTFPGVLNWQRRLWLTIRDFIKHRSEEPKTVSEDEFKMHEDYIFDSRNYYIKGTTFNYCESQQISVAISKLQGLTNSLRRVPPFVFANGLQFERALACQIILMAPMAPHFASELWSGFLAAPNRLDRSGEIKWDRGVLKQKWPDVDYDYNLDLVCQVNGHENAVIKMPRKDIEALPRNSAIALALKQDEIQNILNNRTVVDVHYVMHRGYEGVVNFITTQPQKVQTVEEVS